jgi:N-methylhydantoinase B/oxoprolinase/acetone carboxylase alpha subunit
MALKENYNIVTNVKLNKGDKVKLVTATGGGMETRKIDLFKIEEGYKNGFITTEQ